MENWSDDLNSLIDETTAFAKSVRVEPPLLRTIVERSRMPCVNWISSEREEIRQRVDQLQGASAALPERARELRRGRMEADAGVAASLRHLRAADIGR
jgi:hypothetical protein